MKKQKEQNPGFNEPEPQSPLSNELVDRMKKGKLSKAMQAALDAVENMDKETEN